MPVNTAMKAKTKEGRLWLSLVQFGVTINMLV
jgi:hypothetical protein